MRRLYRTLIRHHLNNYRQMVFLSGPRQVGKTTLSRECVKDQHDYLYLNWDNLEQREILLSGIKPLFERLQTNVLKIRDQKPILILDEIHKYDDWKNLLKGYFDTIEKRCHIIVTGSAKLDVYRKGGDSMMGRYFLYRVHPITVAEILGRQTFSKTTTVAKHLDQAHLRRLLHYGGFPEPYVMADPQFYRRWSALKHAQLFKEDLRDLSKIYDLARLELLAKLLTQQVGSLTKYSELAKKIQVSEPTVREWISVLNHLYYCFSISPWSGNVNRSLLKQPKIYCWDWSLIEEQGARLENFVASHLLKAVHFWTDSGLGYYQLHYLRDKDKHEVDFLVTQDGQPWLMVEVKASSNGRLSKSIEHFNRQLNVPHVFQVTESLPFVDRDCFSLERPMIVPLTTFLSQLV